MLVSVEKPIGRFFQQPWENKRYLISYDKNLGDNETIALIAFVVEQTTVPPLVISSGAIAPDGRQITFYAGGGLSPTTYKVSVRVTTSSSQKFEDEVQFVIQER